MISFMRTSSQPPSTATWKTRKQFKEHLDLLHNLHQELIRFAVKALKANKLTISSYQVLQDVSLTGSCTMAELAKKSFVTPSAMTTIVDRLIHLRLVTRKYSRKDRRMVTIQITPEGEKAYQKARRKNLEPLISVLGQGSSRDIEGWTAINTEICKALKRKK